MAGFDLQKEKTMTMMRAQDAFNGNHSDLTSDLYTESIKPKFSRFNTPLNNSTDKEKAAVIAEEALLDDPLDVEKKVKEVFNEDHRELAENVYMQSKAPKYAQFFTDQSCTAPIGSSSIQTRGDTFDLATKEKEGGVLEVAKKVAVVAGVAVLGWGIYKLLGKEGLNGITKLLGGDPDSERDRKTMKAPERAYRMFRDDFESDPKSYFKELRNSKKGRKPF